MFRLALRFFNLHTPLLFLVFLLLNGCNSLFYHPDKLLYYPPDEEGIKVQEVEFRSKDGTRLYGWWIPAETKPAKGTVVQFHGNAQNMTSHYTSLLWLIEHGYNLFAFDYRGYGVSEGQPEREGIYFDGLAALAKAYSLHEPKTGKFVVYGQSLGSAIAMRCLFDFPQKAKTSLIVMDSGFLSYQSVAARTAAKNWWLWAFSWLPYLVVSDTYSPEEVIAKSKTPLLVVHDHRDPKVSFKNGEEIYEAATSPKIFWKFNQGRHTGTFGRGNEFYEKEFLKLLDKH